MPRSRTILRTLCATVALTGAWTCYEFWDAPSSLSLDIPLYVDPSYQFPERVPGHLPHRAHPLNLHHHAPSDSVLLHPSKTPRLTLSETLFPSYNKTDSSWLDSNNEMIRNLFRCSELGSCEPNQDKVVILGSHFFRWVLNGWTAGEVIWARSIIQALTSQNYTILYSLNNDRAVQLYQMFPQLVKAVVLDPDDVHSCNADPEHCVFSPSNQHGIPLYKLFSWEYWAQANHPLGNLWTLNPEPWSTEGYHEPNTYIGYSVESSCLSHPFIPPSERKHQAYAMTKRLRFFLPIAERAWPPEFYIEAAKATGLDILVGAANDPIQDADVQVTLPDEVTNLGLLDQQDFISTIGESKLLIGVGQPWTSPTPYEALCLGVPFINPILSWDESDPDNRQHWSAQHALLKFEDPPHVYNVKKGDLEGFVEAVKSAIERPPAAGSDERWIADRMKMRSVEQRVKEFVERDWEGEMRKVMNAKRELEEGAPPPVEEREAQASS